MRRLAALTATALVTIATLGSAVLVAAPAAAATTDLVINEVESDGDTTDWVELYNPTASPIDASGLRMTDDNPSRTFTIPASSTVPAHGFLAIDVSVGTESFGLGNGDQVHLWDGATEIDSMSYASHATTTWGLCPDGVGDFVTTLASTKGAANACSADPADVLVINEVESSGDLPDWIELTNTATVAVDAGGLILRDNDDAHTFVIPAPSVIPAGGFLAFTVDAGATAFGLGSSDSARLFDTDGTTLIDSATWSGGHVAATFGRCPDGSGDFTATDSATPAAANDCPLPEGAENLAINEVQSNDPTDGPDWVEIANTGATAVDISGWMLADNGSPVALPSGTIVPAGGYLQLIADVHFTFGLGNGDEVHLFLPDGVTVVDEMSYATHPATTWARCPDATGDFALSAAATPGAANTCDADPAEVLVINEIESSSDGTDWVELTNTGLVPVDAGGLLLKDSGEGNTITIAPASVVTPGGFLAVDVTGLGSSDTARLTTADGTVIDSYTWTAHADETYGRCPDGVGDFADTDASTKGGANDCPAPEGFDSIVINEVESSGGSPADWVELYNTGETSVDLSLWVLHNSEDDHTFVIPAGTTIAPQEFAVIVVDVPGGFGLGNNDRVRLYLPDGTTLVDERIWGPDHAPTTFGLCPDGVGDLVETFSPTKGAPNDCSPVRINEVESSGGAPGDWVELVNAGDTPIDVSGFVVKDNDDGHLATIASGTTLAAGGYLVVDVETEFSFGLGGSDSARLFDAGGAQLDSYTWTEHAATTYARCPDATGSFAVSSSPTRGALNACAGIVPAGPWPGPADVTIVDDADVFGQDMSGLAYEGTGTAERGVLWAVNNGTGTLFKLLWDGDTWVPAPGEWSAGKALVYPDGTGSTDAEGVSLAGVGSVDGVYVATERNNAASGVSRPSVLRYDVTGAGATLTATNEWNLTSILPAGIGNNSGLEGIAWVPDGFLVDGGLLDASTSQAYDPADYPGHGSGLFVVGVEATGDMYAVALSTDGTSHLVATIDPGLTIVAEVAFDASTGLLGGVCDNACAGKAVTLEIAQEGPFAGTFQVTAAYDNPAGMLDSIANEGFAIAPQELCVDNTKPVFYADDSGTAGHSLREAALDCISTEEPGEEPTPPTDSDLTPGTQNGVSGPKTAAPGETIVVTVDGDHTGETVDAWLFSTPRLIGSPVVSVTGTIAVTIPLDTVAGMHRLAVTDADGTVIGWYGLQVTAGSLASTGAAPLPVAPFALAALVAGAFALLIARRRARA
jgi:hypothetical protein